MRELQGAMHRIFSLTVLAPLLFAPGLSGSGAVEADKATESVAARRSDQAFAEARQLLSTHDLDKARTRALEGLSWSPYRIEGYELLADIAETADDIEDRIRWAKWQYWSHLYSGRGPAAATVAAELEGLYPGWNRDELILSEWQLAVERAIKFASGSAKQYLVAGHLMDKLRSLNPSDEATARQYQKLFEKAGEAVRGGAFTAAQVRNRSGSWIRRQNEEHADWANAFQRKTEHYKIITNVSYEFFETISVVMEDMFDFYQQVYGYSGRAPSVTLAIHRRRSDFDRYCQQELRGSLPLGVGGWFYDEEMTVAAYDRNEGSGDLEGLYSVLFHEASHQFMHLLTKKTKQDPPTWLNEGTASFFEGCELKADGSIVKNKPALNRLREWERLDGTERGHDLEELVTCSHSNYDGSYYSYGWALVYFLNNYQDKEGKLLYREAYLEYLNSYTKKSRDDDPGKEALARAEQYFVRGIADPEVADWAAFEKRWHAWMKALLKESKSGPELADTLQARCRDFLLREDFERAMIAAEQADDKRPDDPETFRLLARASAGLGRKADGVYWMLRHWERAWAVDDAAVMEAAEAWLAGNGGKDLVVNYCAPTRAVQVQTLAAMQAADDDAQPGSAMLFACHVLQAVGVKNDGLLARIEQLREESGLDLRLWQQAYGKDRSSNRKWSGEDVVKYEADGVLVNNPEGFGRPREDCDVPALAWLEPPFDIRGVVETDGKYGAYLYLGIGANGRPNSGVNFQETGRVELENVDTTVDLGGTGLSFTNNTVVKSEQAYKLVKQPFHLQIGKQGGKLDIGTGDKATSIELPADWDAERLSGRVGISAGEGSVALFSSVEIRTNHPFWPVERVAFD